MEATQGQEKRRPRKLRIAPYEAPALLAVAGLTLLATDQAAGFAWALLTGAAWLLAVTVEARGRSLRTREPTPPSTNEFGHSPAPADQRLEAPRRAGAWPRSAS
jgi:hypothetical protein